VEPAAGRPGTPGYEDYFDRGKRFHEWAWAREQLETTRNYMLVTATPDGQPHAMPVWGTWQDGAFWFSTGATTRKARNFRANPNVAVCAGTLDDAVIVEGTVTVAEDNDAIARFLKEYSAKYNWPMTDDMAPFYIVTPTLAFAMTETGDEIRPTKWTFND
jgi:PPOX class probable F420-dependent enzyme